jgi:phospholipase C
MKSEIKHIVYLMLENRSLDQLLGWLYEDDSPLVNIPSQDPPTYNGLEVGKYFNVDKDNCKQPVVRGVDTMNVPIHDPHEEYAHVNVQLFGTKENQPCGTLPKMNGFYKDFATYEYDVDQIMQTYTPQDLPVLNGLAKAYAVSDHYFCSVPSQTNCNRAFAAAGNSIGPLNPKGDDGMLKAFVNNRNLSHSPLHIAQPFGNQFNQNTMWNVLSEHGFSNTTDWMHYYSHGDWVEALLGLDNYSYTRDLMTKLQPKCFNDHFDKMDVFFKHAKLGTLPKVSFLEPAWGLEIPIDGKDVGFPGTDYHPPTNLIPGEVFVKKIYDALTSNKAAWDNTLFIINFDEHGGTYDHVGPSPCATAPWASDGTPEPYNKEECFDFKRFGVRVPLLLISPRVQKSTVFRAEGAIPYDHTSVIATILKMFDIPKEKWRLGGRTANAPTFENVFEGNPVRQDIPQVHVNKHPKTIDGIEDTTPPNDIQLCMAHSLLNRVLEKEGLTQEEIDLLDVPKLMEALNVKHLATLLEDAVSAIKNH